MDNNSQINQLRKTLSDLGYRKFQIDEMIQEAIGFTPQNTISETQAAQVVEVLQEYVSFAAKCRSLKK